jgi:microcompartment protein CcmK/EutM
VFIGTVQCEIELSKAHDAFSGYRLLLVHADHDVEWEGDVVAIDMVGAQVGDMVAVALAPLGARFDVPEDLPIDAAVVGLVGSITTPSEEGEEGEEGAEPAARPPEGPRGAEREDRPRRPDREGGRGRGGEGGRHRRGPREEQGPGRRDPRREEGEREPERERPPARREERRPEGAVVPPPAPVQESEEAPAPRPRDTWPRPEKARSSAADDGGFDVVWDSQGGGEEAPGAGSVKNKRTGRRRR